MENLLEVFGVHGEVRQVGHKKPQKRNPWTLWITDPTEVKCLLTLGEPWIRKKEKLLMTIAACDRQLDY